MKPWEIDRQKKLDEVINESLLNRYGKKHVKPNGIYQNLSAAERKDDDLVYTTVDELYRDVITSEDGIECLKGREFSNHDIFERLYERMQKGIKEASDMTDDRGTVFYI